MVSVCFSQFTFRTKKHRLRAKCKQVTEFCPAPPCRTRLSFQLFLRLFSLACTSNSWNTFWPGWEVRSSLRKKGCQIEHFPVLMWTLSITCVRKSRGLGCETDSSGTVHVFGVPLKCFEHWNVHYIFKTCGALQHFSHRKWQQLHFAFSSKALKHVPLMVRGEKKKTHSRPSSKCLRI